MKVSINNLYNKCYGISGIAAFNIFNIEQIHGVFKGAMKSGSPVIIQLTPVAINYMHQEIIKHLIDAAEKIYSEVEFVVHLDHGNYEDCCRAIDSGIFQSVMIDASHKTFQENIKITTDIVKRAHKKGIFVEAELGVLSGIEDNITVDKSESYYTNPLKAKKFVEHTNCDSLAIAVGTSHGAYKFYHNKGLQLKILAEIQRLLPSFPLVLHGASAVPENEISRINEAFGAIKHNAKGIEPDDLLKAIKLGVCKINIATDLRLIWTRTHREFFKNHPEKFDPVLPGNNYIQELEKFVAEKCTFLKNIN